ncbi:hypothetical protein WN943_003010 [Citrus x changshan-huyou]
MERYHFFASSCRQFGYHCQSLSQLRSVVCELEGALASILKDLKRIHNMFFKELANDLAGRDVRQSNSNESVFYYCKLIYHRTNVGLWKSFLSYRTPFICSLTPIGRSTFMRTFDHHMLLAGTENGQREVLKGCKLVFSHAFPSKFPAHIHYLWKVVEQLGATCSIELDPSVTHVVSNKCSNEKVSLGSKGGQVFGGSTVDRGSQLFVARATRREVSCEANQT